MAIDSRTKRFIEGSDPTRFVTKIEASPFEETCEVYIDNPETGTKTMIRKEYEKFVFLRDLDRLGAYLKRRVSEARKALDEAMKEKPEIDRMKSEILDMKERAKERQKEKRSLEKKLKESEYGSAKYNYYDKELRELDRSIQGDADIRKSYNDEIEKYDRNIGFLYELKQEAEDAHMNKHLLPTKMEFRNSIAEYNAKAGLKGHRAIKIVTLDIAVDHTRIEDGYTYMVCTKGKYHDLRKALEFAGLPISGKNDDLKQLVRNAQVVEKARLFEQAYISTGIRNFKGMDIETIHTIHYDLETTGLYPIESECKGCGYTYKLSSPLEVPEKCDNRVGGNTCGCTDFDTQYKAQIFMATIYDNRKDEPIRLLARKGEDGLVLPDEEASLIKELLGYIGEQKPSIVTGYNSEGFDSGFLMARSETLNISFEASECFKCKRGRYSTDGNMYICDNCAHTVTKSLLDKGIKDPSVFFNKRNVKCGKCKEGHIVKGKSGVYGCDNHKRCYTRVSPEKAESAMVDRLKLLKGFVQTTHRPDKAFTKDNYDSTLKLGADVTKYKATKIHGVNVHDTWMSVQRAKAVNSSIKSTSLKYMERFIADKNKESVLNKRARTYIPHENIDYMADPERFYIVDSRNVYKECVGDPEEYLRLANGVGTTVPDSNDYFMASNPDFDKTKDWSKVNLFDKDGGSSEKGMQVSTKVSDFIERGKGSFRLMSGEELVTEYALDDVIGEREVFLEFAKERFLTVAYFPTTFERFATMGVASAWNMLTLAWCYENRIAVPHRTVGKIAVGGLSRMWVRGFMEDIQKMDFSSLYPTIQLALDIFPEFAPYIKDFLQFFFDMRMYYNSRKKCKTVDQLLGFLEEDGTEDYQMVKAWVENGEDDKVSDFMKKYKANADNIQLPCKININGIFGFISSMVGLCGDLLKGCQITASGRIFLRGVIAFMGHFGFKPLVCDTDGINFSNPAMVRNSVEDFSILDEPIPLNDVEWKGAKGIHAFLKRYNELMLPETGYMSLDDDGKWVYCFNAAKKNYINLEPDMKTVKMTGASFKSSSNIPLVDLFFNKEVAEAMRTKDINHLTRKFNEYAELIKKGQVPMKYIVKKARNKQSEKEYRNRGTDKNGKQKAKQAHMELQIAEGMTIEQGKVIYYINNGYGSNDSDTNDVAIKETRVKNAWECVDCGKTTRGRNAPESCTAKVKEKCDCTDFTQVAKDAWECNSCGNVKQQKSEPKNCKSTLSEGICGSTEFRNLKQVRCMNTNCSKVHTVPQEWISEHMDPMENIGQYLTISKDGESDMVCGKKKAGKPKCDCTEYEYVFEEVEVGRRPACYLVSEQDLMEKGNMVMPYNVKRYYKVFANKFEPFKFLYPEEVRSKVIPDFDSEPLLNGDEGFEMVNEPLDSITESLTLQEKEVDFWNESGYNPLELMPYFHSSIIIPKPIPKWDRFNNFCSNMEARKGGMFAMKRSQRFAKDGEVYATLDSADKFIVWKRDIEHGDEVMAVWDDKIGAFIDKDAYMKAHSDVNNIKVA